MTRTRRVRDPVHGFIELRDRENDIVDTPAFQRLRRIRQLAMAHLVYPGAHHTRFEHSLGVLHVASRLCSTLGIDDSHTRIIRLAALLHDVGHGPFSHVSESILDCVSTEHDDKQAGASGKIHERITQRIILEHSDFEGALSLRDREDIASLLHRGLDQRINRDIVSGPLDADKQDYLLRDSYFCGVRYGVYDIAQLHNTLCKETDGQDEIMMVDPDGIHALEQYVLAKYYLTTQVFRHKVRLITDSMLVRAMQLGIEVDKIPFLEKLFRYKDSEEFVSNYLNWDDQRITTELLRDEFADKHVGILFRRLADRRLFKRVFNMKLRELSGPIRSILPERFSELREEMEGRISEELARVLGEHIDPRHVILNLSSIESVRTQSRNSEGSLMIKKRPNPIAFEEESTLFQSIDESLKEETLECYAPVSYRDQKQQKELLDTIEDFVIRMTNDVLEASSAKEEQQSGEEPC